jgi:hypothetical protein
MSILKKLIATAGVFALASASLVSASAATGVTITGYSNSNPSYSLCLFGPGQTSANAVVVSSGNSSNSFSAGLPIQPLPNGSTYSLFVQNASNSCTNGSLVGAVSTFQVFPNHMTNVAATAGTVANSYTFAGTVVNQAPYYSSNNGNQSVNICLGSTSAVTVEFTDPDGDALLGATSNGTFSTSYTNTAGKVTYTVYPNASNSATLGNTQTQTFTATEQTNTTPTPLNAGSVSISFVTVNCGSNGNNGNFVTSSSSSMSSMSSSSVSSTVATPVASTVAASSKAPTTEVAAAPMADSAKGSTVRTGGSN